MALVLHTQRGRRQRKEIERFMSSCEENELVSRKFCTDLMGVIISCFAGSVNVSRDKELAQKQYLQCRMHKIPALWNEVHKALGIPQPDPLWTQTVSKLCFDAICTMKATSNESLQASSSARLNPLPADAENVIRYVAGYIPFKLLHKYRGVATADACTYVEFLEDLSVSGSHPDGSFLDYTKEWSEMISRGGLFKVNDHAYRFFYELEVNIQHVIVSYATDSTKTAGDIVSSLEKDVNLILLWHILAGSLSGEHSKQLFREIANLWLTVRVHALSKEWIELHKVETKQGSRKSTSLRQALQKASTVSKTEDID